MTLVATPAVVLHAFDYMESSRILRLFTRDAGVQSVLARGARASRRRFGGGGSLDLFVEGDAEYQTKPGRELHTLVGFDLTRARAAIALDIGRFTASSALAELVLRFAREDAQPVLYEVFLDALDGVAAAPPGAARAAGLRGAWRLVAELGFAPNLDACSSCHGPVAADRPAAFSHPAGGVLCAPCARLGGANRLLPPDARDALRGWTVDARPTGGGAPAAELDGGAIRAHQRLLREFLREHLADGRPLRALEVWEGDRWDPPPSADRSEERR